MGSPRGGGSGPTPAPEKLFGLFGPPLGGLEKKGQKWPKNGILKGDAGLLAWTISLKPISFVPNACLEISFD